MDLTVTFPGGKKVDAEYGGFVVRTDQPVSQGGEGTAPSPFLYCLAAMGTCAGIYVLSYLQARDLPTEGVKIVQSHEADPQTGKLSKVTLKIEIPPGIPEKHHKPIVRSAEKCAVKKLIEEQPQFEIRTEVLGG
jgi:ribosomal protein S12 methylthiotransferase accessory factor